MSIFLEDKKIDLKVKRNLSFYVRGDIAILIDEKRGDVNRGIWLTRLLEKRYKKDLARIRIELGLPIES